MRWVCHLCVSNDSPLSLSAEGWQAFSEKLSFVRASCFTINGQTHVKNGPYFSCFNHPCLPNLTRLNVHTYVPIQKMSLGRGFGVSSLDIFFYFSQTEGGPIAFRRGPYLYS